MMKAMVFPNTNQPGRRIYFDKETGFLYLCSNEYLVKFPFQPDKPILITAANW